MTNVVAFLIGVAFTLTSAGFILLVALAIWFTAQR